MFLFVAVLLKISSFAISPFAFGKTRSNAGTGKEGVCGLAEAEEVVSASTRETSRGPDLDPSGIGLRRLIFEGRVGGNSHSAFFAMLNVGMRKNGRRVYRSGRRC